MNTPDLAHLQLLARADELVDRLKAWSTREVPWQPTHSAQVLIRRLLERVSSLKLRLEAPLVVAVFGGTGTGKSSLVNALVGQNCTAAGRERPTTSRPVVVCGEDLSLAPLGFSDQDVEIIRLDAPILRDLVLIDCPDPDTSEAADDQANLARLERILPHCDVLLYTSTQQKYRSARVGKVFAFAATGCRLLFVQTHADIDEDIRDDWEQQLAETFDCPEIFLIDSVSAREQQQRGRRPGGDLARLEHLLTSRLAATDRLAVRRANLIDLIETALGTCREQLATTWPAVEELERALAQQHERLVQTLAKQLGEELNASRYLWERRLVDAVTQSWGFSPFSCLLRIGHGLGSLLASASFLRVRSSAQLALLGAWQGSRWLSSRSRQFGARRQLERSMTLGIDDASLRESQLVISGYAATARMDGSLAEPGPLDVLREDAATVQASFLDEARSQIDSIIDDQASRNSGLAARLLYELLLGGLLGFLLYRIGRNFFYDTLVNEQGFLPVEFYLPAIAFLILWSALLVMSFTARLRRGLQAPLATLAEDLARHKISRGLFSRLEEGCRKARQSREQLDVLTRDLAALRGELTIPGPLGAPRPHFPQRQTD